MEKKPFVNSLIKKLLLKKDFSANQFQYTQAAQTLSKFRTTIDDQFEPPYTWDDQIWSTMASLEYDQRLMICSSFILKERKRIDKLLGQNIDPATMKKFE